MQIALMELKLRAETARDVMTPNLFSTLDKTTVRDAAKLLFDNSIGAAPVIDDRGRPVGVFSRSDIARQVANQNPMIQNQFHHIITA